MVRRTLLALSGNAWLRRHAPRWRVVRKAARRFMAGEAFDAAFDAALSLGQHGIGVVFTELGENVTSQAAAAAVVEHYAAALRRIHESRLDGEISVKLTQLGLDVDDQLCQRNLRTLVAEAKPRDIHVWIDMEQHAYLERTLAIYQQTLAEFSNVGVCLQAYLRRTGSDLATLLPLGGGIRLVKGAYREPAAIAYPRKGDVDNSYLKLATRMLESAGRPNAPRMVLGTHDRRIISELTRHAEDIGTPRGAFEFHLLFGIQREEQRRLARAGHRVCVLISYGDEWFAWYMRRLAERPANVLFAVRSMFS